VVQQEAARTQLGEGEEKAEGVDRYIPAKVGNFGAERSTEQSGDALVGSYELKPEK
jgi:hypothetical protein